MTTAIRFNHDRILKTFLNKYLWSSQEVINIGSGHNSSYKALFSRTKYETLDLDPNSNATYIMNILKQIPNKKYDLVTGFNLFEHIEKPLLFIRNVSYMLKPEGVLLLSVPFLYSIHSENDYFRFTKHGIKLLFSRRFKHIKIIPYGNPFLTFLRGLAPIKYIGVPFNLTARLWEFIFRYADNKSPSGYFIICSNKNNGGLDNGET